MNFDKQLEELQVHVAETQAAVKAAANETHDQIQQRINDAQGKMDKAAKTASADAAQAGNNAKAGWAKIKVDTAAKVAATKRTIDRRGDEFDARMADDDATLAESDAADAIDFAEWAVDNARVATLDAIDARVYAGQKKAAVRA